MLKGLLTLVPVVVALCACTGCRGVFWQDPYFSVDNPPSPLDWVEIHYYNTAFKPTRRIAVRMQGNGYVELKKGTSEQISNDFAKKYEADTWRDIKTGRKFANPALLHDLWQGLVNEGLFDREKRGYESKTTTRFIAVKANIQNHTYSEKENIFKVDADRAEKLKSVVETFDDPTL